MNVAPWPIGHLSFDRLEKFGFKKSWIAKFRFFRQNFQISDFKISDFRFQKFQISDFNIFRFQISKISDFEKSRIFQISKFPKVLIKLSKSSFRGRRPRGPPRQLAGPEPRRAGAQLAGAEEEEAASQGRHEEKKGC